MFSPLLEIKNNLKHILFIPITHKLQYGSGGVAQGLCIKILIQNTLSLLSGQRPYPFSLKISVFCFFVAPTFIILVNHQLK